MLLKRLISTLFIGLIFTSSIEAKSYTDWHDRYNPLVIEAVENNSFVSLSNGAILKLRPVLYFTEKGDSPKNWISNYYFARKEFDSVEELFSSKYQVFTYKKGQQCQIQLPPKDKIKYIYLPDVFYTKHEFVKFHGYWCWNNPKIYEKYHLHANFKTIPLNFHDTSVNLGPLRANLNEYPRQSYFYDTIPTAYEGSSYGVVPKYAHLIEADLLEFQDYILKIDGDIIKLEASHINAKLITPGNDFEVGNHVTITYVDEGIYTINNLSKASDPYDAYLSDESYSDLRNYPIFEENGFK